MAEVMGTTSTAGPIEVRCNLVFFFIKHLMYQEKKYL